MPELKLKKRYKAAGDVFNALLAVGFDPETASAFLNDINDADVVEVVRCKDCKKVWGEVNQHCDVYCGLHKRWFDKNAFCSYGERKEQT